MAVMTRVTEVSPSCAARRPLDTWRVYGVETGMVGRDDEMACLGEVLEEAVAESTSRSVSVTGATGLGKSRLLAEFREQIEREPPEVVVVEAEGHHESTGPDGLFSQWFANRYYIPDDEEPAVARRKFTEAVSSIVGDDRGASLARRVGPHIGIPFDESLRTTQKIPQEGGETPDLDRAGAEAMAELLRADAREHPLVLVLDTLQHVQPQSLQLLEHLVGALDDVPVLFLLSWNPDDLFHGHRLEALDVDEQLEIRPLADAEVRDFVHQTLRKAVDVPEQLVDRIVDAAHGNPLSVEEILRILISDGVVDTRQAEWKIHPDRVGDIDLPETVEATVRARLEALTDRERAVLEMAACIGNRFWISALRALYRLKADHDDEVGEYRFDEDLDRQLDELVESLERKDMIRRREESGLGGQPEFHFKHRIERRTIYGDLPAQSKQRYHRTVAQWLERTVDTDDGRATEMIADHYDKAHCLERAARMYVCAAERAAGRYANQKAIDLFTRGLGYLSDADMDLKLSAFHDLGSVYARRGEYDQSLAYFREMLRYAWMLDDTSKAGAAHNKIGRAYRGLGEYDDALDHLERALDLFWEDSDLRGVASTLDDIGQIEWIRGDYDEALRYYTSGLELRREAADDRSVAVSLNNLGSLKLQRGEFDEAMDYYREALELRQAIDDREGVADSYNTLGALCLERDDTDDAITFFREALEIARETNHRIREATYLNNLGEALLRANRLDGAEQRLEKAREVARASGNKRVLFDAIRNLGRVALRRNEYRTADDRLDEAIEYAENLDSPAMLGIARRTRAKLYATWCQRDDGLDDELAHRAREYYRDAIERFREVGNQAKLGRCLRAYGNFLLESGQTLQGKQNLERAREIFERLEIRKLRKATEQTIHQI
jgi:tetratricopeptide (TPR) repeat protein